MYLQNWRRELKTFLAEYENERFLFLVYIFCRLKLLLTLFNGYAYALHLHFEYNITALSFKMGGLVSMNNIFELFYVTCAMVYYARINDVSLHCNFNILLSFRLKRYVVNDDVICIFRNIFKKSNIEIFCNILTHDTLPRQTFRNKIAWLIFCFRIVKFATKWSKLCKCKRRYRVHHLNRRIIGERIQNHSHRSTNIEDC